MYKLLLLLCIVRCCFSSNRFKPVIWSKYFFQGRPVFFGLIRENETVVHLDPLLTAHDKDDQGFGQFICAFNIHRNTKRYHQTNAFPFEIVVVDRLIGLAEVKVKAGARLSANRKVYYKFTVTAKDCGSPSLVSAKAHVLIKVVSADDSVSFVKESYLAYVEEGKTVDAILTILPSDVERSVAFNSTCDYEMLTPNVPFRITSLGVIQNTEPLNASAVTDYFFGVVAKNRQGDHSKPIFVKIIVTQKPSVTPDGVRGISQRIVSDLYGGHDALHDNPSLDELTSINPSRVNFKILMTIIVVTLCVIAVIVIILLILFRSRRGKSQFSDVQYGESTDDLEWDTSTFDLLAPFSRRTRL